MSVRAVRGAIQLERDDADEIQQATAELMSTIMERNGFTKDDFISAWFTSTPDLHADFPAHGARLMGFTDVPLMCAVEIDVTTAMPRVVRVLAHVESEKPRSEIQHVYLRGAEALRRDIAQ